MSYTRLLRGSDKAFSGLGNLSDGEIGDHIKAVTMMYEPEAFATKGEEKFGFIGGAGITRQLDRLQWQPKTGVNFRVDNLQFGGVNGKGHARRAELTSKSITVKHASQQFGSDFDEAGALMEFERNRLGALSGLGRDETVINAQFGPTTLNAGTVKMSRQGEGEATRSGMSLQTKGLEFSANQRNVDQTFETVGQVADPERDLLANIRGFKQSDYSLKFDMVKGLRMALRGVDALNSTTGERRDIKEQIVAWQPDSLTSLNYYRLENKIAGESELLNLNSVERWEFSRQIAKLGSVAFSRESIDYDGSQVDTPDSDRSTFAVSANVGDKTSVSTERTNIKYSDGGSEQIQTHAINKEITNKVGVSVSQTDVKRDGEKADESKRNYGLWYDFGKGLRVQYGFARQINSTASGAMQSNFSMTPGEVGGIKVDSLNYTDQRWDGSRYQSTGNVQLGTTKPLDLGLFKKFTFNYGVDTFRDYQKFQRENRNISAAGLVFGNQFGYEYRSQVAQSGERAIDRLFKFSTGKNDKAPLRATVSYKLRTMPGDKTFAIRNYDLYARPSKNFQITHTLQTNPEVARGDMLLGTQVQSARISKWRLDFIGNESTKFGIAWDETRNDQNKSVSRTGGVNLKLFAKNASPLELFYGLEHNESPDKKRTAHRYHLRFDQQPGPNQMFSIFLGNVNWQNSRDKSFKVQNWASRVEYQLRF